MKQFVIKCSVCGMRKVLNNSEVTYRITLGEVVKKLSHKMDCYANGNVEVEI